mmetsp:Transcript_60988/g.188892  ORF Transcript_60988/g.188892 Transcript_60988/m.188892 type:complete len:225 (-) Transcript_60988:1116-1790(-)
MEPADWTAREAPQVHDDCHARLLQGSPHADSQRLCRTQADGDAPGTNADAGHVHAMRERLQQARHLEAVAQVEWRCGDWHLRPRDMVQGHDLRRQGVLGRDNLASGAYPGPGHKLHGRMVQTGAVRHGAGGGQTRLRGHPGLPAGISRLCQGGDTLGRPRGELPLDLLLGLRHPEPCLGPDGLQDHPGRDWQNRLAAPRGPSQLRLGVSGPGHGGGVFFDINYA